MSPPRRTIVGLGELVWDVFDHGPRRLGGAPANVAYHAAILGDRGVVASSVGDDGPGAEAVAHLRRCGLCVDAVAVDPERPTGRVDVALTSGQPSFTIDDRAAWTAMEWTPALEAALAGADLVCFGSLLLAFPAGRRLLRRARRAAPLAVWLLDLNLRPPLDTDEAVDAALAAADVVKLSEDEEQEVAQRLGVDDVAHQLVGVRGVTAVTVTRGDRGSTLVTSAGISDCPAAAAADRGDAVGAGDAFTAVLAHHLVRGHSLPAAQAAANGYAAFVASQKGAMPEVPEEVRERARRLDGGLSSS